MKPSTAQWCLWLSLHLVRLSLLLCPRRFLDFEWRPQRYACKGSVFLEQLGSVQMIAFDKTGTVTKGQPAVETVRIAEGFSETEVLEAVYAIETQSSHPLAQAITSYAVSRGVNQSGYISIEETSGFGVMAEVSGAKWKIGKAGFIGEEMADNL